MSLHKNLQKWLYFEIIRKLCIAVGDCAIGIIAIGQFAIGIFSLSLANVGLLFGIGQVSIGMEFIAGLGFASGSYSIGIIGLGLFKVPGMCSCFKN